MFSGTFACTSSPELPIPLLPFLEHGSLDRMNTLNSMWIASAIFYGSRLWLPYLHTWKTWHQCFLKDHLR